MPRRFAVPSIALALAGCGGEKSNVSGGVDAVNRELAPQEARLDCPDQVDGAEGAEFECTLRGTRSGRTTKIRMRIVEEGGQLAVDFAGDRAQVQRALRRVTAG